MKPRLAALMVVAVLAAVPGLSQEPQLKVEKIADGVWAARPEKGANVGWFLMGDGVVAVDSGADSAIGRQILAEIEKTTHRPVRALVLTHTHADHAGGARAFAAAGARILCQEKVASSVLALVTQVSSDPSDPLSGKPGLRPVVESVSERVFQVDGLHQAQIYFLGPAHTSGDLVVLLRQEKVLFSGDVAINAIPFMQSADVDPAGWEKALERLAAVPVEKMVPGHGEIGPTSGVASSLAYVKSVNEVTGKLLRNGIPEDQLDVKLHDPEYQTPGLPYSDAHAANVKAVYRGEKARAEKKAPAPSPTPAK